MEVPTTTNDVNLVSKKSLETQIDSLLSGDISLKTQEGDVVKISVGSEKSFAESETTTQFSNGSVHQELSVVAVAASKYSLFVQGDLNEEEIRAITQLAEKINPIASKFFNSEQINLEELTSSFSNNSEVIQALELNLEKSVTAVFSSETFSRIPTQVPANSTSEIPGENNPLANLAEIRNPVELINVTTETVFAEQALTVLQEKEIIQTLREFFNFLRERLTAFAKVGQLPFETQANQNQSPVFTGNENDLSQSGDNPLSPTPESQPNAPEIAIEV